jgi:hypothetical protein
MKRYLIILLILLSACTPKTQVPIATPTPAPAQWKTIQMIHSGGIMGLMRTVDISNNGDVLVKDDRTKSETTRHLSIDELSRLTGLINSLEVSASPSLPSGVCADCFIYEISVDFGTGKPFHASADDVNLSESGLGELVAFLREIMDAALK